VYKDFQETLSLTITSTQS